mmetsp:Transcript_53404/g.140085  ORF Transcript_53404/g.140085 Transcript_53404/m.140085 type:complete len:619 (-) Transcript_53404:34-1890(-)
MQYCSGSSVQRGRSLTSRDLGGGLQEQVGRVADGVDAAVPTPGLPACTGGSSWGDPRGVGGGGGSSSSSVKGSGARGAKESQVDAAGSFAEDVKGLRRELTELRQEVQTRTSSACIFSSSSDVEAIMEAIKKERQDRVSQMADHEQRIFVMSGLAERIDSQVSRHEELIMHMWQEHAAERQQSTCQFPRSEPSSTSDISIMLESLQQRLREEVSAVISKHQSQYAELRDLITRLFAAQQTATMASTDGRPDSALRREIQSLVRDLVHASVRDHVQQALAEQQHSQIQLQSQAQVQPQTELQLPRQTEIQLNLQQQNAVLQLPLGVDTPPVYSPVAIGACPLSPQQVAGAGLQPGFSEQLLSPAQCCTQPSSPSQLMKAQTTVVPVMDAATAALAASAAAAHPSEGFGRQPNFMDGWRSPFAPPSQSGKQIPKESMALIAGEATCTSPGAGTRVPINPAFQKQATGLSVVVAPTNLHPSTGVSGTNSPRAGSGSRNSSRSWPSTTCHSVAAPPPRLATATPTVAVSIAGASGSTCTGGGSVASLGAGMARMASYAQRRRLATSRGATPASAAPPTPAAAQPVYTARGGGLVVRQCAGQGECRPKSHEQHHRCLRLRSTR